MIFKNNALKQLKQKAFHTGQDGLILLLKNHIKDEKSIAAIVAGAEEDCNDSHSRVGETDEFRRARKKEVLDDFRGKRGVFDPAVVSTFGTNFSDLIDTFTAKAGKLSDEDKLAISMAKTKPVQDAVELLSQIDGVKISLRVGDQGDRVYAHLSVGQSRYGVIVDHDKKNGYAIYEEQDYATERGYPGYEGGNKVLENALQSIATIARIHYPDKTVIIDKVINDFITSGFSTLGPQPASAKAGGQKATAPKGL